MSTGTKTRSTGWWRRRRNDFESVLAMFVGSGGVGLPVGPDTPPRVPIDADGQPWTVERLKQALEAYHADHERICLEPNARNVRHTYITPSEDKQTWRVQQRVVDPEEHNDWLVEFGVDLGRSRKQGEPALRLRRMGSLT
ncbi:MAG: DUF3516 domain-containing protein [Verrucomicrobiota bacterium]